MTYLGNAVTRQLPADPGSYSTVYADPVLVTPLSPEEEKALAPIYEKQGSPLVPLMVGAAVLAILAA